MLGLAAISRPAAAAQRRKTRRKRSVLSKTKAAAAKGRKVHTGATGKKYILRGASKYRVYL